MTALTEAQFQRQVTDLAAWHRLRVFHSGDSRRDTGTGFPDLVIVGPGGVVFAELKTATGRPTRAQLDWLDALRATGIDAYLWRPTDLPRIRAVLAALARPVRRPADTSRVTLHPPTHPAEAPR